MKQRLSIIVLAILATGCVSIGSQTVLTPKSPKDWKEVERFGDHYLSYECADIQIHIVPITVRHKISFTGLIIPIFPIMKEWDYSQHLPLMLFNAKGVSEENVFEYFKINNVAISYKVGRTSQGRPFIESTNGDYQLEVVDTIEFGFNKLSEGCKIPALTLVKQSGPWHEFILSMGP